MSGPARKGFQRMARRMNRTPADEVLLAAMRAAMAVSVRAADELGDVSTVQLRALTVLRETPGANLIQLAQEMGVTVSTASRLVDRLVAAGLVDRRQSPQTRREISLSLTRSGQARLRRYDDLRLIGLRACLYRIPDGQHEAIIGGLRLLVEGAAAAHRAGGNVPTPG
jgi:DNA-binding MarR family transcriptional regulator